nr:unnamed protein product [Digitaria exilis]
MADGGSGRRARRRLMRETKEEIERNSQRCSPAAVTSSGALSPNGGGGTGDRARRGWADSVRLGEDMLVVAADLSSGFHMRRIDELMAVGIGDDGGATWAPRCGSEMRLGGKQKGARRDGYAHLVEERADILEIERRKGGDGATLVTRDGVPHSRGGARRGGMRLQLGQAAGQCTRDDTTGHTFCRLRSVGPRRQTRFDAYLGRELGQRGPASLGAHPGSLAQMGSLLRANRSWHAAVRLISEVRHGITSTKAGIDRMVGVLPIVLLHLSDDSLRRLLQLIPPTAAVVRGCSIVRRQWPRREDHHAAALHSHQQHGYHRNPHRSSRAATAVVDPVSGHPRPRDLAQTNHGEPLSFSPHFPGPVSPPSGRRNHAGEPRDPYSGLADGVYELVPAAEEIAQESEVNVVHVDPSPEQEYRFEPEGKPRSIT